MNTTKRNADGATLALYFHDKTEPSYRGAGTDYRVNLTAVTVDPAGKIRNAEGWRGLTVECLEVTALGLDDDRDGRRLIAWETEYRNVFAVDRDRAERMAKTLRLVDARLETLRGQFGAPATFGQFAVRVANALGASEIVFAKTNGGRFYDDDEHRRWNLGDGAWAIDSATRAWLCPEPATTATPA